MLQFCPACGNLLSIQEHNAMDFNHIMKFKCQVCPYMYNIEESIYLRSYPQKKKIEEVLGGKAAWAACQKTIYEGGCEKCGNKETYFRMQQTRSADEPSTRFYRCTNQRCCHNWKETE